MGIGMLLILAGQTVHLVEGMITRRCSVKHGNGGLLFNAFVSFFSMMFFIATDKGGFNFPAELWFYGLLSGLCYAGGFYYMFLALQNGSFAMTRLLSSFGLIIPIFYGLIFLKEDSGPLTFVGITLILASIFLTNYSKLSKGDRQIASKKWLIYTLISVICNAAISILSRMQQLRFDKKCDNEFLIISLGISFAFLFIMGIIKDHHRFKDIFKTSILYSVGAGATNGLGNLIRMFTYLYISMSVMAPMSSGISIILGFVASAFFYKEKFTIMQLVGAVIGIFAVVILRL